MQSIRDTISRKCKPVAIFTLYLLPFYSLAGESSLPTSNNVFYASLSHNSVIVAKIGNRFVVGGEIKSGNKIRVYNSVYRYVTTSFGNSSSIISQEGLKSEEINQCVDKSNDFTVTSLLKTNLITVKTTKVYKEPSDTKKLFAELSPNLRYPIAGIIHRPDGKVWYRIILGGVTGYISSEDTQLDEGIPVLTYHHVLKIEENINFLRTNTTTSVSTFQQQMEWLHSRDYTTLTVFQLEDYLNNRANIPGKAVVLTFDDGLESIYHYAYPILKTYGMNATLFMITSRIQTHHQNWDALKLQFLTKDNLSEMKDIFAIQSHTDFLHQSVDATNNLRNYSYQTITADLKRSQQILKEYSPQVTILSWPYGSFTPVALKAAEDSGFQLGFSTAWGKAMPGDNPLILKRVYLPRTAGLDYFTDPCLLRLKQ